MTLSRMTTLVTAVALLILASVVSPAGAVDEFFAAKLRGANETPVGVSTQGSGVFGAQLDGAETQLTFALFYSSLEGGTVVGAHIHLGQPGITGGIVIHFCGTGGKPACPASPATVSGIVTSIDVVAATPQGIAPGEFAEVVRALRKGDAYVNVHTSTYPGGEIRGQVQ